ncbi:MAG: CHAD domain-containing protein [Nitriliruptoraceae bacterium]
MAVYRWYPASAAQDELQRIAHAQIDRGLGELDAGDRHHAVHAVRKRGKKVRALLRLVRPAAPVLYRRENTAFRDMMRRVATDRDAGVAVETYDHLLGRFSEDGMAEELAPVRAALAQRRAELLGEELDRRLHAIRMDLLAARERVGDWELEGDGFEVLEDGLAKTYGRARARMTDAYTDATSAAFHLWRKRVKYHRYHLQLLQEAWPPVIEAQRQQVHELTDLLGDDHDLAVLRRDLLAEPERFGGERLVAALCGLLDRRRAELQAAAWVVGQRCFAEDRQRFVSRLRTYWESAATAAHGAGPLSDPTVPPGR